MREGAVVIRVTAQPADGKANQSACRLLAERAGVPPSGVEVVRGANRRDKVVRIEGLDPGDAATLFR